MQGMKFNGYGEYLQIPTMQMDAIEIECLVENTQPYTQYCLVDARAGLTTGFVFDDPTGGIGAGWSTFKVNDTTVTRSFNSIPRNQKCKVYVSASSSFTDNATVFANFVAQYWLKGTIYTVKCYLAGVLQCAYDFNNNDTATDVSGNGRHGTLAGGTPVVRKSKQKPKKNLLPPFTDGWSLPSGASIISAYSISATYTAGYKNIVYTVPCSPNTTYSFSGSVSGVSIRKNGVGGSTIQNKEPYSAPFSFTTDTDTTSLYLILFNSGGGAGTFTFSNPQLEQGSTATTFEPYQLIPDVRSVRTRGKKNLLPVNSYSVLSGVDAKPYTITSGLVDGATYTLSGNFAIFPDDTSTSERITMRFSYLDGSLDSFSTTINGQTRDGVARNQVLTVTANPAKKLKEINGFLFDYSAPNNMHRTADNVQIELGSTATPFEPYTPIPDVRTVQQGLRFNGLTDYVQLPSMQMDAIEIECLIDIVQGATPHLFDARTGAPNVFVWFGGVGSAINMMYIDGVSVAKAWSSIPMGVKTKIRLEANAFTDDATLFSRYATPLTQDFTKAALYSITCYLAGNVKARYLCNEGTGTVLTDYSGNGNHGTIVGAQWMIKKRTQPLKPVG